MPREDEKRNVSYSSIPRRRKRRRKKRQDLLDIPGVKKITLSELTQKIIECVVGEDVTSESPWKYVKKELVQDNLELHEESSEFLPLRGLILAYPRPELLIGYIVDETQENDDEFYICVTEEATDTVQKIIERLRQEQEDRLYYQLYKDIREWQSLGSELEVDESLVKNNRPLLEVEVETKYPIFPGRVQFRLLPAESKRDGYMELRCSAEENVSSVHMRRIDNAIQVAPAIVSAEAQTTCTYPRNAATQYLYETEPTDSLFAEYQTKIVRYANEHLEDLSDLLRVNGDIDLYANDFDLLVKNSNFHESCDWTEFSGGLVEYQSLMDVNLCKGKMISDICWHRMWSGTIAIAYCDVSPKVFHVGPNKDDEVYKAVHSVNIVLIWSFVDALKPKLILESPREIERISFCKFDENILIGGCKNGQIVIWDIRNKLQKVEEKEVLTTAQQKYRNFMHNLMGWMKDTNNIAIVRPAAVSDLRYSHKNIVTGISWVEPHHEFSKTGNLSRLESEEDAPPKYSMQFLTSSLDGTILIWDLNDRPSFQHGDYRPKKLKRLKKKPSALQVDVSPFRVLNLNLKPKYRINVTKGNKKNKIVAITRSNASFCSLRYEEKNPVQVKKRDVKERVIFKPIMTEVTSIKPEIKIGTVEGTYAELQWEGQDFDSGEMVNCEQAKYIFQAKYHDGPITSIYTSREVGFTLTVGGKVFALWRSDFPGRPVLWRRSRQFYTMGEITFFQPFKIVTHSVTGVLSRWILTINSKAPVSTQVMSNGFLTASAIEPQARQRTIYGIGDEQGAFRLFYGDQFSQTQVAQVLSKAMKIFLDREVNRKNVFLNWQENFNKRNKINLQRMKEEAEQKAREEAAKEETKNKEQQTIEKPVKKGPQPGKFVEWITEQRQLTEEARIKAMIISKKQLDTKDLEKRRKPLQKLDEENERKKRKQKERLKQGETIFQNTISSLFPDVVKEKPAPPPDPYAGGDSDESKENCYKSFEALIEDTDAFIANHPFHYEFNFKNLLVASRNNIKNSFFRHPHAKRYEFERNLKTSEGSDEDYGKKITITEETGVEEEDADVLDE